MADIADMLKNLLDDPGTVDKLKGMLGGSVSAPPAPAPQIDGIDPAMLIKISKAMKRMNSEDADNRTRLLRDLKPYISPARAKRVDEAVNILRMLWLAELFKDEKEGD